MKIVINNEIRKALELTIIQYCVMEYVSMKAINIGYTKPKDDIATTLGISRNLIYITLDTLYKKGLLNKSNHGRTLMPTAKWNNMFRREPLEELPYSDDFKKNQPLECYFDGACEPVNPGGNMGMGWIIVNTITGHIRSRKRYKEKNPTNSNNVAEYLALYMLLKDLRDYSDCEISIYGDSKLIVNQINNEFKLNSGLHYNIAKRTAELYKDIANNNKISISWIPREVNTGADKLSKEAVILLHSEDNKTKSKKKYSKFDKK